MAITVTNKQGYSRSDRPSQWTVKPRQPICGNTGVINLSEVEFFRYDLATPYGLGNNSVSNASQTDSLMVAWGMIVRIAVAIPSGVITFKFYADLFDGTLSEIDPISPTVLPASAKIQLITLPAIPAFRILGTMQSNAGTIVVGFHVSCTDY